MATKITPQYLESRLQALSFTPLNSNGSNFLEWVNDAKVVLAADDLSKTLEPEGEEEIGQVYKPQALLTLRRHLDQSLRLQYITLMDPEKLWNARFDHQQSLFLPQAHSDWINLWVLDCPNFVSFNSELYRIMAQLKLCGESVTKSELIEKTLSIFPPATAILL